MRRRLSLRRCLTICRDLWDWMAETKAKCSGDKWEWPGWKKHGEFAEACPCCQYVTERPPSGLGCPLVCPLRKLWNEKTPGKSFACVSRRSPYMAFWAGCGTPRVARKIADFCRRELARMKGKR